MGAISTIKEPLRYLRMLASARKIACLRSDVGFDALFDAVVASRFPPIQNKQEIVACCDVVLSRRPKVVCEIGSASGGTLYLFSRCAAEDAKIFSIDLNFTLSKRYGFKSLLLSTQKPHFLPGDSHSPAMASRVKALANGAQIDFLFIDGDHSYEGATADYELFSPMVAADGLIGFHDIIPDYLERYGKRANADSGGVPTLWAEIKARHPNATTEFVCDYAQDGFGIGLLDRRLT